MLSFWFIKDAALKWQSEKFATGQPVSAAEPFRAGANSVGTRPTEEIDRAIAQLKVPSYATSADIFEVGALWAQFQGKP